MAAEHRGRIGEAVAFSKRWRRFIAGAAAHLLTPPEPLPCRTGWVGVQLCHPGNQDSLVFVFRLGNAGAMPKIVPAGLAPARRYRVRAGFGRTEMSATIRDLHRDGLPLTDRLAGAGGAEVYVVEKGLCSATGTI